MTVLPAQPNLFYLPGDCGECGKTVPSSNELRRCKRCEVIVYCSRKCERDHWKQHKKLCNKPSTTPSVSSEPPKPGCPSGAVVSSAFYRPVLGLEPDPAEVAFACWCCAKLLLKKTDEETKDRYFYCETYGRRVGGPKNDEFIEGESYPSALASATLVGVSTDEKSATSCLQCAHALQVDPQKHLQQCEEWLSVGKARNNPLMELNMSEIRCVALVILEMNPDFSLGPNSIAGYTRSGNNPRQFPPIPFNHPSLEAMAFPHLFPFGDGGFEGSTKEELFAYTNMRLASTDNAFRRDYDYVTFSLFRLVAFGVWDREAVFKSLPAAIELGTNAKSNVYFSFASLTTPLAC